MPASDLLSLLQQLHCWALFSSCCAPGPPGAPQQRIPACAGLLVSSLLQDSALVSVKLHTPLASSLFQPVLVCEMAFPAGTSTSRPVWCHQQTWGQCSQTPHPGYLWWCWKVWVPASISGDALLVPGCQPELSHWLAPSECTLWAQFLLVLQATSRYPAGLSTRALWETVAKALLKLVNICCSASVDRNCYFVAGARVGLAWSACPETALAFPNHMLHLALVKLRSTYRVLQPGAVIMEVLKCSNVLLTQQLCLVFLVALRSLTSPCAWPLISVF